MREIRFRAWDGEKMILPPPKYSSMIGHYLLTMDGRCYVMGEYQDQLTWMQFTGLLDKNGKEIYEGDILGLDGEIVAPVTFEDGSFQLIASKSQGRSPFIQKRAKKFVIVGNIYQDNHLLEAL